MSKTLVHCPSCASVFVSEENREVWFEGGGGGSKEESRDLCDSVCRGIRLGSLSVQEERRNLSQLGKKGTLCQ